MLAVVVVVVAGVAPDPPDKQPKKDTTIKEKTLFSKDFWHFGGEGWQTQSQKTVSFQTSFLICLVFLLFLFIYCAYLLLFLFLFLFMIILPCFSLNARSLF